MKFIRFEEATSEILLPEVGPIPFFLEGMVAVTCIEFTNDDLKTIKRNGGRIYLVGPATPAGDQPLIIRPFINKPFVKPHNKINGKNHSTSQGPSDDK